MKLNDPHIQMLVNPRALKLNNILIIIKNIINIKDDIETLKINENLINWAMAQGFIVTSDDVNVIDDVKNNQVIICITFAL